MFIHYRTPAVIVKKIDRGEADQLLIAYTRDFGRVEISARSIRKISSKLRSATEFVSIIEIEFIQGKACKTLTDAVIINSLGGSKNNLQKSAVLRQICRFTENLVREQQQDARVWDLLRSALLFAGSAGDRSCDAIFHYYIWHLFGISGWRPEFTARTIGSENFALVKIFRDSDVEQSAKIRLAPRQNDLLLEFAEKYLLLVTK